MDGWRVLSGTIPTQRGPLRFHYPNVLFWIRIDPDGSGYLHAVNRVTGLRLDRPCAHPTTMGILRILDWARQYGS